MRLRGADKPCWLHELHLGWAAARQGGSLRCCASQGRLCTAVPPRAGLAVLPALLCLPGPAGHSLGLLRAVDTHLRLRSGPLPRLPGLLPSVPG